MYTHNNNKYNCYNIGWQSNRVVERCRIALFGAAGHVELERQRGAAALRADHRCATLGCNSQFNAM
jgi:hypothetical protein